MRSIQFLFVAALAAGAAYGEPVAWTHAGEMDICPATMEAGALVPCNTPISGRYETNHVLWPARDHRLTPGGWFRTEADDLKPESTESEVRSNQNVGFDSPSDAHSDLSDPQTVDLITGTFGLDQLPADPPKTDPAPEFQVNQAQALNAVNATDDVPDVIATVSVSRDIPEVPPVFYFGLGVILISMRRFFASAALATRRLVAPRPLTVTRPDAMP